MKKYNRLLIGNEISKHRLALGMTQEQAAEKADLSHNFFMMLEHGKVGMSVDTLLSLCDALHTTPETLLTRKFQQTPESEWIAEKVATLAPDKQKALVELIQVFLRTF